MGLFQRQPINLKQNLPYTLSFVAKTVLIIGLGNPGLEHELNRHNAGFMAVDRFAADNGFEPWQESKKFKGQINEKTLGTNRVLLLKPTTYMNVSGEAAQAMANYYRIALPDMVAVYDELSIPFGQIRSRVGGQAAGHNGVKSLIDNLGKDFGRIRIGIKNGFSDKADQSEFVLGRFTAEEQAKLPEILSETGVMLTEFIFSGQMSADTRRITS